MSDPTVTETVAHRRPGAPIIASTLAAIHAELGGDVVVEAGAELVWSYGDPEAERAVATGTVGVADITVRTKVDVRGDVDRVVSLFPGDVIARITAEWAVLLSPPGPVADRVASMQMAAGSTAMVTDVTHLYAGFALSGPLVPDVIARLSNWDPASLEPGAATGAPIADIRALVVRREESSPILEIYVATELARYAWRSILDVVGRLGGGPVGWDALRAQGWR